MKLKSAIFCLSISSSGAFSVNNGRRDPSSSVSLHATSTNKGLSRPEFIQAAAVSLASLITMPQNADALVKGNAPPPKKGVSDERKCRNVEECQEMADRLADKQQEEARANMVPASLTKRGTAYRDVVEASAGAEAKVGDTATIYYKVLKLGKRSYDGLSGEGTVVFSRGYGLEDDEDKAGVKSFSFAVGQDESVIGALNDGIVGQKIGSTRRISITPQMGWEKASKECDGGPGGSGSGGELKTDYVVVPTATMVATEICFDKEKRPFPKTYAEQRRMAQRFDQSLIIEVELVDLK
jgi:FKBP-type peptidyl-prolyl cis-trans isomerase